MGAFRSRLPGCVAAALACLSPPTAAQSMCDVIPGVTREFRGALGSLNRPFAIPNDDGEQILVRLRPVCEPNSNGFADLPGGLAPEDDYFVTVLFEPPGGGARNAVVLGTAATQDRCQTLAAQTGALPNGVQVTCASRGFCSGGSNDGGLCTGGADCPGGTCLAPPGSPDFSIQNECIGGPSAGQACADAVQCGEIGACLPFRLRFRFPDTDALVATPDDDRTLTGPAAIAVTPVTDPLPVGLASARCADTPGLVACIDELYARDGTCETTPDHIDPTFGRFTALPPPNDYQALCTTATPGSPCTGLQTEARFAVDAAGNALIPMEYRGVLIQADRIPVPRLIQGNTKLPAFGTAPAPVTIPSEAFLSSWAPGGQKLPPIFTPIADPTATDTLSLFGSVDAPVGVIRVQRRGCVGGGNEGRVCTEDTDCGPGASCATLFDFSDRLAGGVGPVLIARAADELRLDAQSPVPLDGLIESQELFAFVANEAIGEPQDDCTGDGVPDCTRLNDDSDGTDPVLRLRHRATGESIRIGTSEVISSGAEGRAVTRVRDGRFRFPAVAVEGDLVAFLELEPLEGDCADPAVCDSNANGSVFDPILRVFRLGSTAPAGPCGEGELTCGLDIAVDAAPLVAGRSLAISEGRIYFRTPEWRNARQTTERVSVASDGAQGLAESDLPFLSADGRVVAFGSDASNLVPDDANGHTDVLVHDRAKRKTERVSVTSDGSEAGSFSIVRGLSGDGRIVVFEGWATNLAPDDANNGPDVFVHDRITGETARVSVDSNGTQGDSSSLDGAVSGDGNTVAFNSNASNLVPGDSNNRGDTFVHDRITGATTRASVASDGTQALDGSSIPELSLTGDGRTVAFVSDASNLVSGDTNGAPDVFLRDRIAGKTTRVSVASDATQGNNASSNPWLSRDGRIVAFSSLATNLVAGEADDTNDVFVHDRTTRETARVSVAADGTPLSGESGSASVSGDGQFVAFESLVRRGQSPTRSDDAYDVFVHDRRTGATERLGVALDGSQGNGTTELPSVSSDGRFVGFSSESSNLVDGDTNGVEDVFVRGPDLDALDADLSGDGALDDVVLEVLDTTVSPARRRTLLPATQVAVAAGSAAFLVPTQGEAGRVHLSVGGGPPEDLGGGEALEIAFTSDLVAARVLAPDGGEASAEICDWPTRAACWRALGTRATAIDALDSNVALLVPECGRPDPTGGSCLGEAVDRNEDGDARDRLVQVYRADARRMIEIGQSAEDLVLGQRLVAFHTREAAQGTDLNADGDGEDDVLQVFDLVSERLFNTQQAVIPCPLEACDPRFPYRVDGDTVVFITAEGQQSGVVLGAGCQPALDGGCDLNGDGDSRDLVKQVFNAREAALLAGPSPAASLLAAAVTAAPIAAGGSVDPLASASAGVCTSTGDACATNAECGEGTCYLPPGGCIADLGTPCECDGGACRGCAEGEFCEPFPGGGGSGTCHEDQGPCARQAECADPRAVCRDASADSQRLLAPTDHDVVTSSGSCVEATGTACTDDTSCPTPELCGAGGSCERRHGSCLTDADCAPGQRCAPNLVTLAAADGDGDALPDPFDNCPEAANADQADLDGDGFGDCCDLAGPDEDSDGVPNPMDNCRDRPNPNQRDSDSDGLGNACDLDHTNDGVVDGSDLALVIAGFGSRSGSHGHDERIDVNGDGVIGGPELLALGRSFGATPAPFGLAVCGARRSP